MTFIWWKTVNVCLKSPSVNTATGIASHPEPTNNNNNNTTNHAFFFPATPLAYLGTQLGDDRSTSHVAYRFMWTGRLEVMLTGLEGCMCGEGTPPVRGSPPRSDILEAGNGLSLAAGKSKTRSSLASRRVCSPFSGASFSLEPKISVSFAVKCVYRSCVRDGKTVRFHLFLVGSWTHFGRQGSSPKTGGVIPMGFQ